MNRSTRKLKIAQVCPLWEQVPPKGYGGIELIASWLTEELVQRGHEVTLLASGDSKTTATLRSPCDYALRHEPGADPNDFWTLARKHMALVQSQLQGLYEQADDFDIIHSHLELDTLPFAASASIPTMHTMHMNLIPEVGDVYARYPNQHFISISDAQRTPYPSLNYLATVYNAIDFADLTYQAHPQQPEYLAFLGRLSPDKGIHLAIEISKKTGIPLKVAGKCTLEVSDFYETVVKPEIDGRHIEYLGEISQTEKSDLLGNAIATLFPITWREPFGLVMIESMACGTPVLGTNMGAVPEVIANGKTGFVCETVEEMVACIDKVKTLDRQACRTYVETQFSIQRMVDDYEDCYYKLLKPA